MCKYAYIESEMANADLFKALGHPKRLELIQRLIACGRPCGVTELNECCTVDFSVVSRHLALLRDAGILRAEKKGREVYYSVASEGVVRRLRALADAFECCGGRKTKGRKK